jgi:hypothetical protein
VSSSCDRLRHVRPEGAMSHVHQGVTYVWWDEIGTDVEPTFAVPGYGLDERDNLAPALEAAGYTDLGSWFTGDGDSFGPLSRCVRATAPDGDRVVVVYG